MDIQELKKQLNYLEETKQLIKEQLVAKGQPVDDNTTFREYVDNMNDLIDTTDANAETSDIATGKSGYVDGQKVDGNLRDIASGSASSFIGTNFTIEDKPQFNLLDFTLPFTVDLIHRQGSTEQLNVMYGKITSAIELTADKIKAGETVLGINGKTSVVDTEDANAIASDLALDKTAYVNGQKITGTLETTDAISVDNSNNTDTHLTLINMGNIPSMVVNAEINDLYGVRKIVEDGVDLEIIAPQSQIADVIGLTADKIALGETILEVTGTYAGSAMKEYASVTDMNDDIANISEGELVKVVESGITTYFIKEILDNIPTMTKLVKESETMSPQEYEDANDIADEILGE